jgi:DNA-directed RNA polymerase subunit M/transcription elongation factor TFIIS
MKERSKISNAGEELEAPLPFIHDDCPACGYAPLHHRVSSNDGVSTFYYHCTVCGNQFQEHHSTREE